MNFDRKTALTTYRRCHLWPERRCWSSGGEPGPALAELHSSNLMWRLQSTKSIRHGLNTYILFLWGLTLQIEVRRCRRVNRLQRAWFGEHPGHRLATGTTRGLVCQPLLFWSVFVVDSDSNRSTRIYSNSAETQNDFLCPFWLTAYPGRL